MRVSPVLFVLAAAAPCLAQGTQAPLPASLVTALFSGMESVGRGTVYTIGEPPAGWPIELQPSGGTVVGGMAQGRTLVAVFADTSPHPLTAYHTRLRDAGFTQPAPRAGNGFNSSGGPFNWYCRDSTVVTARMAPGPEGTSYLRVSYAPGMRASCSTPQPSFPRSKTVLELPSLPPPAGVRSGRGGGSAGENEVSSEGVLDERTLAPSALLAHYAKLLTAAGWTAMGVTSDSSTAAQLFRARDTSGRTWHGVLSIFATTTGRELMLEMRPDEETNGLFR